MGYLATCECGFKVLQANLPRHRRSNHHMWRMEIQKAQGLVQVKRSKEISVLTALGTNPTTLKTRIRVNNFGGIAKLFDESWAPEFDVWLVRTLLGNLPKRQAMALARDLRENDPARLVLLRLSPPDDGQRERLLALKAAEMGFRWANGFCPTNGTAQSYKASPGLLEGRDT